MLPYEKILESLAQPLPGVFWAAFGALAAHAWGRIRSRVAVVRWQAHHPKIAFAAQDALFGTIQVAYNGQPVPNLFLTTIAIQNASSRDLQNLEINIAYLEGTRIYQAHGNLANSFSNFLWTPSFSGSINEAIAKPDSPERSALREMLSHRRDFLVPVLNRLCEGEIRLLVESTHGQPPQVSVACDHSGVSLQFRPPVEMRFGVEVRPSKIAGLLVGVIVVSVFANFLESNWALAFSGFFVGAYGHRIGAETIRAVRWLARLLG